MKFIFILFAIVQLFGCSSSYQSKQNNAQKNILPVSPSSETYIVKTVKGFDSSIFSKIGGVCLEDAPYENLLIDASFYLIRKDKNINEADFIKRLEEMDDVFYVERNRNIERRKLAENESFLLKKPFGLDDGDLDGDEDAAYYEYALRVTKARNFFDKDGILQEGAYKNVGYGDKKVVVAIIDTGLNMRHADFSRAGSSICLYAKSMYESTADGFTERNTFREIPLGENEDSDGHGTHCSGTMCAVEGNGGVAGVAYKNTYIISYKGIGHGGVGSENSIYLPLADLAEIVNILKKEPNTRTVEEKAKIPASVPQDFVITQKTVPVNMSLGSPMPTQFEAEMINLALKNNILPVVAMGNDGRVQSAYPRSISGCVAVGATNEIDRRAHFSDAGEWMSVSAPGSNIVSTSNGTWKGSYLYSGTDGSGVKFLSGTSMATPFVTGLIGYLLSFPEGQNLNACQVKRLLEVTAEKIDSGSVFGKYDGGHSLYYGYGRVDVLAASRCIAKKSGAHPIPQENEFYITKPLVVKAIRAKAKIKLYEVLADGSFFPQGASFTDDSKTTMFYCLKKGVKYRLTCLTAKEKEAFIVATDVGDMEIDFSK